MKKFLYGLLVSIAAVTSAYGNPYHHNHGRNPHVIYAPNYRHNPPPRPRYNQGYNPNYIAPLIGLGVLGIGGAIYYNQRQPVCTDRFLGYDTYGRKVYQEVCR